MFNKKHSSFLCKFSWVWVSAFLWTVGCKEDDPVFIHPCPTCTSTIQMNEHNWPSKPFYSKLDMKDSVFSISIDKVIQHKDRLREELFLYRIPFRPGVYIINDSLQAITHVLAMLNIYSYPSNCGTPVATYRVINDGTSKIHVISTDKNTGQFSVEFDLLLSSPWGYNSLYPDTFRCVGEAQAIAVFE